MDVSIIDLHFLNIEQAIAAYLIETSAGPVLIETGPHSSFPSLEKAIKAAGYEVQDIQHVFLSHIHLDHAGAAWVFAKHGAKIHLHPFGKRHLHSPEKLMASAKRIYKDDMDRLWGQMHPIPAEQLIEVAHEAVVTVGDHQFKALHTPGHAVHHIAWVVGDKIFTGDVAGVKIGGGPVVPPCPPPDINVEDWEQSIALLKAEASKGLYLTHYGLIEDIDTHLNELLSILHIWADWIKPYYLEKADPQIITPKFQAFVQAQLLEKGVDEKGLQQYEAANPSWMSVAGLLRYWHKKLNPS